MYRQHNENPINKHVGDCTVRAISKALNQSWDETYCGLVLYGFMLCDMPSANNVWGAYLKSKGYKRHPIDDCPDCYTVYNFCDDHKQGTYILALASHVVAVIDGDYYDIWDSGDEMPIFYWKREED